MKPRLVLFKEDVGKCQNASWEIDHMAQLEEQMISHTQRNLLLDSGIYVTRIVMDTAQQKLASLHVVA